MLRDATIKVFTKKYYIIIALVTGVMAFSVAIFLPNIKLVVQIFTDSAFSLHDKFLLFYNLYGSLSTNFTAFSLSYTIAIAILFGLNIGLLTFYLRNRISEIQQSGMATGALGVLSGVLGVGCAACGSIIASVFLPLLGGSALLSVLPLHGSEFGILSVILLSVSYYLTAKQIQNPAICKIAG